VFAATALDANLNVTIDKQAMEVALLADARRTRERVVASRRPRWTRRRKANGARLRSTKAACCTCACVDPLEIANKASSLTGGADGSPAWSSRPSWNVQVRPVRQDAYLYCLAVLLVGWWVVRRLIYSPFGTSLTGVRENSLRMHAIGAPVYWRLVLVYTISATVAGVAGGLLTQTNQFVGLNVLSFESAGELLVMFDPGRRGSHLRSLRRPRRLSHRPRTCCEAVPGVLVPGDRHDAGARGPVRRGGILGILDGLIARLRRKA